MVEFCPLCGKKVNTRTDTEKGILACDLCGAELRPLASALMPGSMVGGFRIENELGRGGMGIVYRACQINLSRDIALKILSDDFAGNRTFVDNFFNEAKVAANLSHPNIVQAYDAGVTPEGIYYFAMELIRGETLDRKISRMGALPLVSTLMLAQNIADALAYAWNFRKMCHGDIKPDNILITDSGICKLADLGLARSMYEERHVKSDVMVTPLYAAPEIISGAVTSVNLKSDIYSFGATIYHVLAGTPVFSGEEIEEIYAHHLHTPPQFLSERNRSIPEDVSRLLDRMLEKDPAKRPESWDEISETLLDLADREKLNSMSRFKQGRVISKPLKVMCGIGIATLLCILFYAVFLLVVPLERKNAPEMLPDDKKQTASPNPGAVSRKKTSPSKKSNGSEGKSSDPRKNSSSKPVAERRVAGKTSGGMRKNTSAHPSDPKKQDASIIMDRTQPPVVRRWYLLKKKIEEKNPREKMALVVQFIDDYASDENIPPDVYRVRNQIAQELQKERQAFMSARQEMNRFLTGVSNLKNPSQEQLDSFRKTLAELKKRPELHAYFERAPKRRDPLIHAEQRLDEFQSELQKRNQEKERTRQAEQQLIRLLEQWKEKPGDPQNLMAGVRTIRKTLASSSSPDSVMAQHLDALELLVRILQKERREWILENQYLLKNLPADRFSADTLIDSADRNGLWLRTKDRNAPVRTRIPFSTKNLDQLMTIFQNFYFEPEKRRRMSPVFREYLIVDQLFRDPGRASRMLRFADLPNESKNRIACILSYMQRPEK